MAANQVTVATPGPAGVPGLTYEGLWVVGSVYQVRDCVRYTDGNLYVVNVQHTSASGNNPVVNTTYWSLFINANDAYQWATEPKHSLIGDSLGNAGYSALHQAAKAQDWATLTTDAVTNDTNVSDVEYSAKAWAIGGTEVTTTALRGAAKEWAIGTGRIDHPSTGGYSAKEHATGTTVAEGSAKEWAQTTGAAIDTTYSSKEYAQGAVLAAGGSAKNWAQLATTPTTTATDASAKEWATGVSTHKNEGSAKDWATYTTGDVRGASAGSMSAKEWAIGVLGRGVASEGSSKDWATRLAATVDNAGYSAQEWAVGTTASTGGSAKDWAIYTAADVRGASSGEMSAKEWALGVLGRGQANEGSSKDWATRVAATVDNAEYSAKEYSQGSVLAAGGSSKNWAQLATTPTTTATDASAKEWATGVSTHKNEGSSKDWAVYTAGDVRGAASGSMSSKEWSVGTQGRGVAGEGSSKDWATRLAATVDNADWSAKEFAIGTTASTGGSAKDWAIYTTADVRGASSGEMSSKEWAVGILGRGVSGEGSSKDWAIRTGATVDNAEYSAKEYAYGTTVAAGSAKDWAILAEDSVVDGSSGYSALHWAAKADDSRLAAKASAAAVANTFDAFDDTYLGSMRDAFIFTASSSSGLLITDNDHGLLDGNIVQVASTTTLPTGISAATNYYVRDKTTNTFKLATSSGGTAIAYTNAGSGVHSWVYGSPTTNGTWALNSSSITVVSNVGIRVGQKVSGSGIPASPVPNVLSVVGTTVVISENMAAANVGTVAVTFSSLGINGPFSTTKDGPTTDNDGGALVNGMLYFNTTDNAMMIYKTVGTEWIAATASGGVSLVMHKVTASGGETSFAAGTFTPALTYEVNNIVVFLNGVRLDATDYTATTGTSITGLVAVAASDELTILAFKTFEVADAVSAVSGGTFTGAVTFNGGLTANTADINGGTFDGIVGGTTPAAGSFTTIGASGAITGALTGNASTATTLATARTIGMTGDVVWTSPTFDGSGNVTAVAAIQANSVTMGTDTTGNYVATVTAGTGLTSTGATSGESIAHSLSVDAAQTQITSVGTLTTLTVDNVIINGTTIGHTSDTDLLTLTSGNLAVAGDVFPSVDATSDLGSASKRWDNIYTTDLHLANERGNWTIIEEENYLSIRNNKTDKIYKLIMEELHDNEPHIE